jgi:hypothetical protein
MRLDRVLMPLITVYFLYSLSLVIFSLAGFPKNMHDGHLFPYLAEKPVGEDAYYMLTVAWNMASGRGIVYNYNMPVTGIQPLATALYAIFAWVTQSTGGDQWLFVRSILLLTSVALLLFGHLVGKLAYSLAPLHSKDSAYVLGFLGIVFNFSIFRLFTYGLETGIYLILFALCILYSPRIAHPGVSSYKTEFIFGVLGGLTIWARIDFGIVFFIFLAISTFRRQLSVFSAAVAGAIAILVISPWFLYVFSVSGRWMPSSGPAQAGLITHQNASNRIGEMGAAILDHLTPWFYFEVKHEMLTLIALFSLLALLLFLFRQKEAFRFLLLDLKRNSFFMNWMIAISMLVAIYVVMFRATHFYMRYSAPLVIPFVLIMAIVISKKSQTSQLSFFTSITVLVMCFFGWAYLSFHTERISVSFPVTAGFIQTHASTRKVGAFQSGVVGFFNTNVVNLDGKVNRDVLSYLEKDEIHLYIDAEKVDIIIDWAGVIQTEIKDPTWLASFWEKCLDSIDDDIQHTLCLQRKARQAE